MVATGPTGADRRVDVARSDKGKAGSAEERRGADNGKAGCAVGRRVPTKGALEEENTIKGH